MSSASVSSSSSEGTGGSHRPMYTAPSHSIPRIDTESIKQEKEFFMNDLENAPSSKNQNIPNGVSSLLPRFWFQSFVALTNLAQRTRVKVMAYATMYSNLIILVTVYLMETASYHKDVPAALKYIIMGTFVLSGLHTTLFLLVGFPFLYPSRLLMASVVDFATWVSFIVLAVLLEARWREGIDEEEVHWISVLCFLLVIRLNTFAAFNMRLNSLVFKVDVNTASGREIGVPIKTIERLVSASELPQESKQQVIHDVHFAGVGTELNRIDFDYFLHGSMRRNFVWNSVCSKQKLPYNDLLAVLDFDALVPEDDRPFLVDRGGKNEDILSAIILAIALLFKKQKLLGTSVILTLCLGAFAQPLFVVLVGKLVNLSVDMASMSREDDAFEDAKYSFMLGIAGLVARWLMDEALWYYASYVGAKVIANATARVQLELAQCALYGDTKFEDKYNCGALSNVVSASLAKTEQLWFHMLFRGVRPFFQLFSAVVLLVLYDVSYCFFVVSAFPVITSFRFLEAHATNTSAEADTSAGRLLSRFQNAVNLQRPAKVYNAESFVLDRFKDSLGTAKRDNFNTLVWSNMVEVVFGSFGYFMNTVTTIVFLFELADGRLDAGSFYAVTGLVRGIIWPLESIGTFCGEVARKAGAIYKVETVLSDGGVNGGQIERDETKREYKLAPLSLDKDLVMDSIVFSYGHGLPVVLNSVSTRIASGTYTCVMGKSGSGKSTLLSLMTGSRTCNSGRITMDGIDISTVPVRSLRDSLGVVFQETYVLDATIFDNISFGCFDDSNLDWDERREIVTRAAKDADVHEFIETLPAKYDTVIGKEATISLSGGQAQRICGIARALARRPKLLILDECTSSLDKITESLIIETMERLRDGGLTILSFTHNPATTRHVDNIVVLDKGVIAQTGTYEYLKEEQDGLFSRLIKAERRKAATIATVGADESVSSS